MRIARSEVKERKSKRKRLKTERFPTPKQFTKSDQETN